ncbi:ABC transporter substrate-binding protein [Nocardioides coralli]|uniref:ABC transporter substrate-binding protein n=1 Tax=Nocardioides coralli TaxID=2872154 RepID=UPI001CA3A13E|nr:ABC transporter substrate-binding protein [Nocardioides coralli]QZY30121.1 ABC transporter substrate-binding protein [Nocardioides coralli]
MRSSTRTRLLLPLLASVVLGASACSAGADRAGSAEPLRIVGPFEVHSLDPALDGEVFTRLQVSETLVTSDLEGELTAGLATTWSSSRGDRAWTFTLPRDATFHDGTPVTPGAVVAALEKAAQEAASPLAAAPIRQIRTAGASVVVELSRPYLTLPAVLTHYSTAILAPASYGADGHVTEVIGTGPYRVTSAELPASIQTTRFDNWRGEAPAVEDVTFQAVGRPESRALMAVSDQADVVFGLEPAGRERVSASDDVQMASSLQPRTILLKVNAGHPVLRDVRVRRALSMALDREAMAEAVLREEELAATRLLPPSLAGWQSDGTEELTHDVEQAESLLEEAGWTEGADGIRVRDGEPLRLTLLTYPDRAELPALATAIQAALREVGVELSVTVSNSSEIPSGQADGSLELALIAKHFALVSDPLIDVADVFAPEGSDWGVMSWSDPAVDRAVEGLLAGATGAEATRHRETIVDTAQEELPLIPVSWYRMNAAVSDRVEGFRMDPLETSWRLTDLTWSS